MSRLIAMPASGSNVSFGVPSSILAGKQMLGRAAKPSCLSTSNAESRSERGEIDPAHQDTTVEATPALTLGSCFAMKRNSVLG